MVLQTPAVAFLVGGNLRVFTVLSDEKCRCRRGGGVAARTCVTICGATAIVRAVRKCQLRGSEVERRSCTQWQCGNVWKADVIAKKRRVWGVLIVGNEIELAGSVLGTVDVLTGARFNCAVWVSGSDSVTTMNALLRAGHV